MRRMPLTHLKEKQSGRIIEIEVSPVMTHKLNSMGILVGREVTKLGQVALKGAVAVKSGRTILAIGHSVASKILIEVS